MKDKNIEEFVSSATFVNTIASQFKEELDLNEKQTFTKASYQQDVNKIIRLWNKEFGNTWRLVTNRQPREGLFMEANEDEPWKKINNSIQTFNKWFEDHSSVFKFDHSFSRE